MQSIAQVESKDTEREREMGVSVLSFLLAISGFLILSWIWKAFNAYWLRPKRLETALRKQGIRGPPYIPFSGNLKENFMALQEALSKPMDLSHRIVPRVFPFFDQTVKTYGKTSMTWIGPIPRVTIMDPELIKEVLSNFFDYEKPKGPLTGILIGGLVEHEGEKWAKHRRIINPAFHIEKLKGMLPAFLASCCEMVSRWEQQVGSNESCQVDVWPEIHSLTADVISRTAFGSSYEDGRRIFQLLTELAELVTQMLHKAYIPGLKYLPTKENLRRKVIDREMNTILGGMIEKREKAMKAGEARNDDLLGLLLESNFKESQQKGNSKSFGMSIEDVMEDCRLFYFAGQETTASLVTWTMITLAMHPNWQKRAREEVLQVYGKKKPDFDGLSQLKTVTMILYEVLRLYPPGVILERHTFKEMQLGGMTVPAGVQLSLPIILIHHDPDLWGEDAQEFKPGRFAEGVSKATNNQVSFFPFGWGPRICIGQNFAIIEAKLALSMILQHFSFELSPWYAHAPCTVLTLRPQHGASLIMHKL